MVYGISWKKFLADLYAESKRDNIFNGAAALGFYLTLAIFPGMVFVMAVIPYLPIANVDQAIMNLLRQALPSVAANTFASVVDEVTNERRSGLLSLGLAAALWASSSGMYAIMQQMNIAFDVGEGRSFLKARGTALALTLLFGVLVIGAFSLVVLGGIIQSWIGSRFGVSDTLLVFFAGFRWVIILLALLLAFALVYYLAPNVSRPFVVLTPGNLTATFLLIAASLGFRLYTLNFADFGATYGSIGAVIVLMLWLYMAGFVILLGAEINVAVEHCKRSDKQPADHQRKR
jgi:membrane protein